MHKSQNLMTADTFPMIAKTVSGLEPLLAEELRKLGAQNIIEVTRAVSFEGDKALMYKANYCVRTALRILRPISQFVARTEDALYDGVGKLQWHEYFKMEQTFAIDAVVSGEFFNHSHYAGLRVKDAIVDQFRNRFGERPSVEINQPDIRINVHIYQDQVSILLDSSGESLHKRGYRTAVDKAPINEVLAAGLILLTGWDGESPFVDAMCGSGTIPIEAAMLAMRIPPAYFRERFGFMSWPDFDSTLWEEVKTAANDQIREIEAEIIASDRSGKAIDIARENIRNAHLHKDIKLIKKPMENLEPPEGEGVLVINPPYGERLEEEDLVALYKGIGDSLKQGFKGYKAWVISSDQRALKMVGLKPSKKYTVYNGPLECRFARFDIFSGSYKAMKTEKNEEKG
jgi:putative N6-adenine-specific DNA methylase